MILEPATFELFFSELGGRAKKFHWSIFVVRLDFKPMLSHVSLLKLVLEMDERIQILQKILPAEKWSLQTYKAFQFLSDKEIADLQSLPVFKRQRNRKITKKIYFCLF